MLHKLIIAFLILVLVILSQKNMPFAVGKVYSSSENLLAEHQMSLNVRYPEATINEVFRDNILLTLFYLSGNEINPRNVDWNAVRGFKKYELVLEPGEVFAFHDDVLPEYREKTIKTTHARFGAGQGFRSSGYLYGDGVCHLASLIHWAAKDAGLKVDSRVNHDFANIPQVPKIYGTSIVTTGAPSLNAEMQNLYIENTLDRAVTLVFTYERGELFVAIYK